MKPLYEAYHTLTSAYHEFTHRLPEAVLNPEFPNQFQRTALAFGTFARYITDVYSSLDPGNELRLSFKSSSLYVTGEAFMHEWIDFINIVNRLTEQGISPHLILIDNLLNIFSNGLNVCVRTVNRTKYRTNDASQCMTQLRDNCLNLRAIAAEAVRGITGFDPVLFDRHVIETTRLINTLFDLYIPKAFAALSTRTDMVYSVSAMAALLRAVQSFDENIGRLRRAIVGLNVELSVVHEKFRLPFTVELWTDVPRAEEGPSDQGQAAAE
jgi:hypothetical protein